MARFLTGPPRIAPLFDDLDPSQAGGVFRRTDGDALLLTWCDVPEFDSPANRVNVQLRLAADGAIDFVYGAAVKPSSGGGRRVAGRDRHLQPRSTSARWRRRGRSPAAAARSASVSRPRQDLDFVALTRKFYETHGDDFDQLVHLHQHEDDAAGHVCVRVHGRQRGQRHRPRHLRLEPGFRQPRPAAQRRRHGHPAALPRGSAAAVSRREQHAQPARARSAATAGSRSSSSGTAG